MRIKKVRGQKRVWKDIEEWKNSNLELDIDKLKQFEREYVKIWVHPFSSISLMNSEYPEPKSETKNRILNGLFDIYESWKKQLDELKEPYYLKIWLYEPCVSNSQVVCSIGSLKDFYKTTFHIPENPKKFNSSYLGTVKNRAENYNWEHRVEEQYLDKNYVGELEEYATEKDFVETKKWYESKLKKPHRKIIYKEPINDVAETYAFKLGEVWIGEK